MAGRRRGGRRIARGQYKYTPKRAAALKRAQYISARKRKGSGKGRNRGLSPGVKKGIIAGAGAAAVLGTGIAANKFVSVQRVPAANRPKTESVYLGPLTFSGGTQKVGAFRSGGGTRTITRPHKDPTHIIAGRFGHRVGLSIRPVAGQSATRILFGSKTKSGGAPPQALRFRRKPLTQAEKDAQPVYNPKSGKGWPHIGAEAATLQNEGVRAGTHYIGPEGVKRWPDDPKAREAIQTKLLRRMMGLGFTMPGEVNTMWAEENRTYIDKSGRVRWKAGESPSGRKRRRRKKKK